MASTFFYFIVIISCVNACIKMVPPDMEGMPVTAMPVTDEPITNKPVTDEPVTNEPVTDEPVTNEPITEEPVTNEPITDEPVTEEPITDETVTDEPITDAPITDAPVDCTTCNIKSLFNPADIANDPNYFQPDDSNIRPDTTTDCASYSILCYKAAAFFCFTYAKDENGMLSTNGVFINTYQPLTCNDDGKFVFQGTM